jgi:hypothetical protein
MSKKTKKEILRTALKAGGMLSPGLSVAFKAANIARGKREDKKTKPTDTSDLKKLKNPYTGELVYPTDKDVKDFNEKNETIRALKPLKKMPLKKFKELPRKIKKMSDGKGGAQITVGNMRTNVNLDKMRDKKRNIISDSMNNINMVRPGGPSKDFPYSSKPMPKKPFPVKPAPVRPMPMPKKPLPVKPMLPPKRQFPVKKRATGIS